MMNRVVSFGEWVRARRRAKDLTQEELARRVACAVITIRKIETDERRPSRPMAERLAEELELSGKERDAFVRTARQEMRVERLAASAPLQSFGTTSLLPAPTTPLIGRERELETVKRLLFVSDVRLLTLTGTGGTGKTRLALAMAQKAADAFPDGVYFVSLAPLTTSSLVLTAITQAVGIVEIAGQELIERVQAQLGEKRVLLVLDNFEQVIEAAPVVAELLLRCPNLKVLVTSRVNLHLSGEHTLPVLPFPLPEPADPDTWEIAVHNEAVRLFAERAQAVNPAFILTETVVPIVAEICRWLDGLPLAIELAAARSTMLSPPEILARLERSLQFLAGGPRDVPARQRTMRTTIDWSYGLLREPERALLRQLAVFSGSWTLRAAEAVCAVEGDSSVFEMLSSLVDHSLIRWEGKSTGEGRFRMLETLREYASERLEESGELEIIQRRHAAYFLVMVEEADTALRGPGQLEQLERLEGDHDNLREALRWCLTRSDVELSYRFVGALWRFWFLRGHFHEWEEWWRQLPPLSENDDSSPLLILRAAVVLGRAFLAHYETDLDRAMALGGESLELFRLQSDPWGIAASLTIIGAAQEWSGGEGAGTSRRGLGVARARAVGDPWLLAWSLQVLGDSRGWVRGEHAKAAALLEESLALARQTGDCWLTARALIGLAQMLTIQHDYRRAAALAQESLTLYRALGDRLGLAWALHELGSAAFFQADYAAARRFEVERLATERTLGNLRGVWHALWSLEMVVLELDDADQVRELSKESLALAHELGEPWRVILSLRDRALNALLQQDSEQAVATAREAARLAQDVTYGWVLLTQNDAEQSRTLFQQSLELEQQSGSKRWVAECLEGLAAVSAAKRQIDRAARLFAAAARVRQVINTSQRPSERQLCDPTVRAVSETYGVAVLHLAGDESETAQIDAVIADALAEGNEDPAPAT